MRELVHRGRAQRCGAGGETGPADADHHRIRLVRILCTRIGALSGLLEFLCVFQRNGLMSDPLGRASCGLKFWRMLDPSPSPSTNFLIRNVLCGF
jgi:hypothetical protein